VGRPRRSGLAKHAEDRRQSRPRARRRICESRLPKVSLGWRARNSRAPARPLSAELAVHELSSAAITMVRFGLATFVAVGRVRVQAPALVG
jgi:hypothetical protein